jgi:signal peptidase II
MRLFALLAVAGTLCGLDLWTKHLVFAWLGPPPNSAIWWIWPGHVGFQTALNEGALFGLGQGLVAWFVVFSAVAVIGIVAWLASGAIWDWGLTLTLALILGGILGNLYDRLGLWRAPGVTAPTYAVRDWILVQYDADHVWPNFNLADSCLVCGAALLMWRSWPNPGDRSAGCGDSHSGQ